ncbi:MAG: NAD(+)/NADH kinase [Bacteroidales bacterium]|jgi:NAD+ kinase|nr:NAD(+)/NADH kinase [Bacteroidales bacterium]MCI2122035.1 NAD(+)/NADH kinase [Bacteroidales bacterium]MCI2145332.1 NAD(+)/NADH kinase [Bacteroidales bacterium]
MTVAIFGRDFDASNTGKLRLLLRDLVSGGASLSYSSGLCAALPEETKALLPKGSIFDTCEELPSDCRLFLALGGDGTFLTSLTSVRDSGIPVAGINFGRLGFLTAVRVGQDSNGWVSDLLEGKYRVVQRTVLQMRSPSLPENFYPFAINEAVVQRRDSVMLSIDVCIDGEHLPTYWADGLLVATPTGSTAYSLSIGGPIVRPDANVLIISPVAPHNLNVRPLIVPDTSDIEVTFNSRGRDAILTMDNRMVFVTSGRKLVFGKAGFKINSISLKNSNFIEALQEKLFWGEDKRNDNSK